MFEHHQHRGMQLHKNIASIRGYCEKPFCFVIDFHPKGSVAQVLNISEEGLNQPAFNEISIHQRVTFFSFLFFLFFSSLLHFQENTTIQNTQKEREMKRLTQTE
jgi:hypothetical protein